MIKPYSYSFSWVPLLLIFMVGCSDYSHLNRDLDHYRPPDYTFFSPSEGPEKPEGPAVTEFEREKKQIDKAKVLWEKALEAPQKEASFFTPSSQLLKTLKPAAKDGKAALEALAHPYSLGTLETLALIRNPRIQAARDDVRAAIDTYSQVMALDDILRQYSAFTAEMMTDVGPVKGKEPMRTLFPFPGVLSLKGEIVNQSVREAFEQLEITKKTVVTEARRAYWNLLYLVKAEGISGEVLELYRYLERVAASRYETGGTNYQDVIKVRIRREILEEDLKTVTQKKQNVKSRILALLNLPPEARLSRPEDRNPPEAVPPLDGLYKMARQRRQELKRMRDRVGKMERLIELAETRILPQYTLGFSFHEDITAVRVGTSTRKTDFPVSTRGSRGAGLPLMPWYGIGDAYIRETRQKLKALKKELTNAEATTDLLVREAWYRLDLAKREETLYRNSVLKLAKDALDVSTRGYEAGNVSFADVIASYGSYLNQNLSAQRKLSDMGVARADLEMVVGAPLAPKRKEMNP
ncbi:MAG: TolC family protein [Deltaproteobacteria bacterium]|nr:TolC family protein [Deltaproteobacteria bacterium]